MNYNELREELRMFYWHTVDDMSDEMYRKCMETLDKRYIEGMNSYEMKILQFKTITELFQPHLFKYSPFYYEMCTLSSHCDGGARVDRWGHVHAGAWTYWKNEHLFVENNPEMWDKKQKQIEELLYTCCGAYNDDLQHFNFNVRPILQGGLKSVYEKAHESLKTAETSVEKDFLTSVCEGLICIKKISEKFSEKAKELLKIEMDNEARKNLQRIAETASRVPWEAPQTLYEALNTHALMRVAFGSLEGIGPNTFGRLDMDLYPFYESDLESGRLTKEEAYELICKFLITWDLHYDHDEKMVLYADHELENTYTLGGCDLNGNPMFNDLTGMFLRATEEEKIIYPKIKCRFSADSPKEYLDAVNSSVIKGTSTLLYQNDDATIPALIKAGRTVEEARDYIVSGCWGLCCQEVEKPDFGAYVNTLRAFEYAVHNMTDRMEKVGIKFKCFDDACTFEEVYQTVCENCRLLIDERNRVLSSGACVWSRVDPHPIFSSTLENCIESKKDFTAGGAKYRDDHVVFVGLPNIVDSLLAIKTLCFDTKTYSLKEMLDAVRSNWENAEEMRQMAMKCPGWGDGSKEGCELADRFNNDLYDIVSSLEGVYGGKIHMGHLNYSEVRYWGEQMLATPDGRKDGDCFSQGLTPSRLKKVSSVTDAVNSFASLDASEMAGNTVVNIIMPPVSPDICEAFIRVVAGTAIQSLQLNCTTKETLLDAQKHPENYPDLIIRVCGYSAKFTSLSPEWQNEVITRNFYV